MRKNAPPTPRALFEARHQTWLAPYAVREATAGPRAYAEPPHPYRTCFQRDRDRIVHCTAFRRLDFKTQVFVPHEHDHYRTRMTHTLEVAQIARTLGRALQLNEDLVEAIALAHDLGHPPFGHGGEAVLDELMADHGRFEHNRQSLRIVDYLEHPYPQFRGLNLTAAARECLAKHQTRYDTPICEEFDNALQPPLEGQIVDRADEIAYTSADLEDAMAAGWIEPGDVEALALWRLAWRRAESANPDARPIHKRIRACKAVVAVLADDLLETTAGRIARLAPPGPDAVRQASQRCVAFSTEVSTALAEMHEFLMRRVYLHPSNVEQDQQARKTLRALFGAYVADPALLPERYQRRIEADGLHRVVCDYVAGMTDRFCRRQYEVIVGARSGPAASGP